MVVSQEQSTVKTTIGAGNADSATMTVLKATEEFMDYNTNPNCVPPPSDSGYNADLFDSFLGGYDLNEIPTLFNVDPQQMASELDSFDFFPATNTQEVPFLGGNHTAVGSDPSAVTKKVEAAVAAPAPFPSSQGKRAASTISEDESNEQESPVRHYKTRRVIRGSSVLDKRSAVPDNEDSSDRQRSSRTTRATGTSIKHQHEPISPKHSSSSPSRRVSSVSTTSESDVEDGLPPVDTSTEHVKALTGAKGAAMCFDVIHATMKDEPKKFPNLASAELDPQDKAQFSRDRNRLHARNTRIRKKAYVDELKRTLNQLVAERDSEVEWKTRQQERENEERSIRYNVLEEFVKLRTTDETDFHRWDAILEPDISFRLPHGSRNNDSDKDCNHDMDAMETVSGVEDIMKESHNNCNLMGAKGGSISVECHRDSFLMEGSKAVMDWTVTASFTDSAKKDTKIHGTCRADFDPYSNKIHSVDMFYDSRPFLKM